MIGSPPYQDAGDERASAWQRQKRVCVFVFLFSNAIKVNTDVNQKQGLTFRPANFLTDAFIK